MKIIHCSDLHLDSKMETNLPASKVKERSGELRATFARLVNFAKENDVQAVLLAGDLFDSRRVSRRTADFVAETVASAPEVDFFYLRGNHDEAVEADRQWPENWKTFDSHWTTYRYDGLTISGVEPEQDGWTHFWEELTLSAEDCNIVMLHGQESVQPGQELIPIPKLRGRHIHYLALGHIHSFRQEKLDDEGTYCYCGCLEGRGFDECGPRGFVLLQAENGRISSEFVPFASRTLEEVPVDITDLTTVNQLRQAMEQASAAVSSRSLVKFVLLGTYTPQTQKDFDFLTKIFEDRFYFVKIKDESRFKIEKETYEHDASLKGEFVRLVMASDKSEEEKARIICAGLQALSGEEVAV